MRCEFFPGGQLLPGFQQFASEFITVVNFLSQSRVDFTKLIGTLKYFPAIFSFCISVFFYLMQRTASRYLRLAELSGGMGIFIVMGGS